MEIDLDNEKKLAISIKEEIETATDEKRIEIFNDLYNKWICKTSSKNNMMSCLMLAAYNFGFDDMNNLNIGLYERYKKIEFFKIRFLRLMIMNKQYENEEEKSYYEERFNKLMKTIIDADNAIISCLFMKSSMIEEEIGKTTKIRQDFFRYEEFEYDKLDSYQSLLLYLYEQLLRHDYRRHIIDGKGMCYEKIYTKEGHYTHAWKPAKTIREFVQSVTSKNNPVMWANRTRGKSSTMNSAVDELTNCIEGEFDDLIKDRHVFSFTNGIYFANRWCEEEQRWLGDEWVPFEGPKSKKIGDSIIAAKIFNEEFIDCSHYEDWFDIIRKNCPNFRHIMEYQNWPEDVQQWLCILIGRLIYDIKELGEDWQVIPFLLGQAGSGKSTIIDNVVRLLYDHSDIGVLSNNSEKKFGLSALVEKLIFIAPEINSNIGMDQTEFQQMISGEMVQVNVKYKIAHSTRFKAGGIMAGNEPPGWNDNAGQLSRRLIVFPFERKIQKGHGDTKLSHKLKKEIGYIIQASNKGYLKALEDYGSKGIWEILPDLFQESKETLIEDSNCLSSFLKRTDLVELGDPNVVYCKERVFVLAFTDFCKEQNKKPPAWSTSYHRGPFAENNIVVKKNMRRKYPRNDVLQKGIDEENKNFPIATFFLGVDIVATSKNSSIFLEDDKKMDEEFE